MEYPASIQCNGFRIFGWSIGSLKYKTFAKRVFDRDTFSLWRTIYPKLICWSLSTGYIDDNTLVSRHSVCKIDWKIVFYASIFSERTDVFCPSVVLKARDTFTLPFFFFLQKKDNYKIRSPRPRGSLEPIRCFTVITWHKSWFFDLSIQSERDNVWPIHSTLIERFTRV